MQNIPNLLQQLIENRICFEKILLWRAWIGQPTTELTKATDDRKQAQRCSHQRHSKGVSSRRRRPPPPPPLLLF
jgi:hypothetical protein